MTHSLLNFSKLMPMDDDLDGVVGPCSTEGYPFGKVKDIIDYIQNKGGTFFGIFKEGRVTFRVFFDHNDKFPSSNGNELNNSLGAYYVVPVYGKHRAEWNHACREYFTLDNDNDETYELIYANKHLPPWVIFYSDFVEYVNQITKSKGDFDAGF